MPLTRRRLLRSAPVLCGVALPGVFGRVAPAAGSAKRTDTVLVVVQLGGANDGLNTVVPFRNPDYLAARPTLKVTDALPIAGSGTGAIGLHPAMKPLAEQYERGRVGIVQGVGLPRPNRSHFEAMDVWHRGTPDADERLGWLGRAVPRLDGGAAVSVGAGDPPLALFGAGGPAPSIRSAESYRLERAAKLTGRPVAGGSLLDVVRASQAEAVRSAARVAEATGRGKTGGTYPATGLGERLSLVADLIDAELPERVYHTALDGFDTHAVQPATHERLLGELAGAVAAFLDDLADRGHLGRVLVLGFSEFGRRVAENGSLGTDHGAAGPVLLAGGGVRSGLIGAHPSLTDLDDGDLKTHTDFRRVYAALLDGWLGVDSAAVLGGRFAPADVLRG